MNTGTQLRASSGFLKRRSLRFVFITTTLVSTLLLSAIYVSFEPGVTSFVPRTHSSVFSRVFHKIKSALLSLRFRSENPQILIWTTYFGRDEWIPEFDDLGCPVRCSVTRDRNQLNSSRAVIFHLRDVNRSDLPFWRNEKQVWVLFNQEAPPHTPVDQLAALQGKINWTISYRRDSDIYAPYGRVLKRETFPDCPGNKTKDVLRKKNKRLVCWLVSNCLTPSNREKYVEELKRHIPVFVTGKCGRKLCHSDDVYNCYVELAKSCKFYLSFENSLCTDYATEKVYYALQTGMVPVVMGGESHTASLPNHSYINALRYKSPKHLASFLLEVDEDEKLYESYLDWKNYYEVKNGSYRWICNLCQKLHRLQPNEAPPRKLDLWWFGQATCYTWYEYLSIYRIIN